MPPRKGVILVVNFKSNEAAVKEEMLKLAKQHFQNAKIPFSCPKCGQEIMLSDGLNSCPHCAAAIDFERLVEMLK